MAAVATLLTGAAAAKTQPRPSGPGSYDFRILDNPTSGDEFGFRNAFHGYAQGRSNRIFTSLASLLGGDAPTLNFVPTGSDLVANHMSANLQDQPDGSKAGQINMDPLSVDALINDSSPIHSGVVNQMPHEMAHTRQTQPTLAQLLTREGGAQAFADLEAAPAAQAAGIPYTPGNYDGAYAELVQQIMASKPQSWILGTQFGR